MQKKVAPPYPMRPIPDAIRKTKQEKHAMAMLLPDRSFYPSPKMAMQAPSKNSHMWRC